MAAAMAAPAAPAAMATEAGSNVARNRRSVGAEVALGAVRVGVAILWQCLLRMNFGLDLYQDFFLLRLKIFIFLFLLFSVPRWRFFVTFFSTTFFIFILENVVLLYKVRARDKRRMLPREAPPATLEMPLMPNEVVPIA